MFCSATKAQNPHALIQAAPNNSSQTVLPAEKQQEKLCYLASGVFWR